MAEPPALRPIALPVSADSIPSELKTSPQFVGWRYELRDDKWTKPPICILTGEHACSTDLNTCTTYELALRAYRTDTHELDGIGYVLIEDNNIVGFDFDHCRNSDTGEIDPWALELIHRLNSYTEVSPSSTGLRVWTYGTFADSKQGRKRGDIEMYRGQRFLTLTGCHLEGTPTTIEWRQDVIDAIYEQFFHRPERSTRDPHANGHTPSLEDAVLLEKALNARNGGKLGRLLAGDLRGYPSPSEADLAICSILAFWTQDSEQIDRLVRGSALFREKWGRPDYRDTTIAKALAETTEHWKPSRPSRQSTNGHQVDPSDDDRYPPGDDPEAPPEEDAAPEWLMKLSKTTKDRVPHETLGNVTLALQHLQPWATDCWYDEVRDLLMVGTSELDNVMVTEAGLMLEAQTRMRIRSKHLIPTALAYLCHQRPWDLLREWLESLPPWDGMPRLHTWLPTYAHAPNDAYGGDVSRLLVVSPVARARDPGCQYRYVVILEGPENAGKTKLVRALATPEWYRELSHGLDGKEAHMRIKRAWIAELAELASLTKTEEARLKSFFTMNEDVYIPKYSNLEAIHKRRTVFVGTVNPEGDNTYLRGQTGNTRYLPIAVRDINVEGFQAVRTQLFAEALQYYVDHPDDWWRLSSDGESAAQEAREDRRQRSVYEDDLGLWLERTAKTFTWWEEIAKDYLSLPKERWADRRAQMEVAKALKALGWAKDKRERVPGVGLIVPWRPGPDWRTQE